ncbi:MAG: polymer-forming cytoskeletal protein [Polyangiaceae bacterium]
MSAGSVSSRRGLRGFGSKAIVAAVIAGATLVTLDRPARADVRFDGNWTDDAKVSLVLSGATRADALRALAEKAGWSLVLELDGRGSGGNVDNSHIELSVTEQPASKVLAMLLADGRWVATRDGTLVRIAWANTESGAAPAVPSPPEPPNASKRKGAGARAHDVDVFGDTRHIAEDETVHDITVFGGRVDIDGHVTGDLAIFAGQARVTKTGHIDGDASVMGGRLDVEPGGRVDGDVGAIGGVVNGAENAKKAAAATPSEGGESAPATLEGATPRRGFLARAGEEIASRIRSAALLFVIGVIVIALGGQRAESVRAAIADRPMKAIALGIVGLIGMVAAIGIAAVTIVGIPIAVLAAIAAVLLGFSGVTSAFVVLGAMLFGHKTKNVYVHLAIGSGLFFAAGLVPVLGGFAQAAVFFAGLGGVVATRAMGFLKKRPAGFAGHASAYR